MNEPVILWDQGMDAPEERAWETHERVGRAHEIAISSGAYYDRDNNEISIVMTFSQEQAPEVTHDGCNARRFVAITEISDLGRWWRESPRQVDIDGIGFIPTISNGPRKDAPTGTGLSSSRVFMMPIVLMTAGLTKSAIRTSWSMSNCGTGYGLRSVMRQGW